MTLRPASLLAAFLLPAALSLQAGSQVQPSDATAWRTPQVHRSDPAPAEDLVVIANASSGVTHLTQEEVVNIYMGRQKRLPSGLMALPVEAVGDPELRTRFYGIIANVSLVQVRSYWARLFFSGQAQPPRQAQTVDEVIQTVLANRGAIGFIPRSRVDSRVRSVLLLREGDHP